MSHAVTPCIWMDNSAEEAANFYIGIFPNSQIDRISRYIEDSPFVPGLKAGTAMLVNFTLDGRPFATLNGGPMFPQSEAVSFVIPVETQTELDRYWDALVADGGSESRCGWCKDRFGVSWQVVPAQLLEMQANGTAEQNARMMAALMTMGRLDIGALEAAYRGDAE